MEPKKVIAKEAQLKLSLSPGLKIQTSLDTQTTILHGVLLVVSPILTACLKKCLHFLQRTFTH